MVLTTATSLPRTCACPAATVVRARVPASPGIALGGQPLPRTGVRAGGRRACSVLRAMDPRTEELYLTLGVSPGASQAVIKKAHRQAAKRWHPDVCDDPEGIERFMRMQEAYEALLDEKGSLNTVGQALWREKWQAQVNNLRKAKEEKEAAKGEAPAFETEEERRRYLEMKRNVSLYEKEERQQRVASQLGRLKSRARRRKPKPPKPVWVEPFDYDPKDDAWNHSVQ